MFSGLSIRFKITSVVALLLVAMACMGGLAMMNMRAMNENTVQIAHVWLPSIRALGELRNGVTSYRNVLREHMLARDAGGKGSSRKAAGWHFREQRQDPQGL